MKTSDLRTGRKRFVRDGESCFVESKIGEMHIQEERGAAMVILERAKSVKIKVESGEVFEVMKGMVKEIKLGKGLGCSP